MDNPAIDLDEQYAALVETFLSEPGVTQSGRGFGSSALKIDGKIFAMLTKGALVVKLPRERVDALVKAGEGERFDPGHGRLMKEWLRLESMDEGTWRQMAREAMEFVGPQS